MNNFAAYLRILINIITFEKYFATRLTTKIALRLAEHNYNYSKFLITLSSSAIALTFIVLQLTTLKIKYLFLLKAGWIFFALTILFGLIFHILNIIREFHFAQSELIIGDGRTLFADERTTTIRRITNENTSIDMARISYVALGFQTILFFISTVLLVVLLILNF